ncbi:MAG: alpha/beta hydrolase [Sphingobacteriales bacterium]|nr:MAG: alpha/beta hydrolase [Sphingobacteriales bacterium]
MRIIAVLLLLIGTSLNTNAQKYDTLGARLENYSYPFAVSYMRTNVQQTPVELAYMDVQAARPNGSTVVLMHGKNFPSAYWKGTIDALTGAGYRVIAPDALGFGKSSKPMVQYSFSLLADLTRQLLDTLNIDRAAIIGHSMGGMLASRFALSYPDRVTVLVLEDALGLEDWRSKGVPYRKVDEWYADEKKASYGSITQYHKTSYYPKWKPEYQEWIDVQYGMTRSRMADNNAWVSAVTYDMIFNQPVVHEFANIKVPTLVVVGTEDRTKLARNAPGPLAEKLGDYRALGKQAANAIPGAKLISYEGVGHLPHLEIPGRYHKDLIEFLDKKQ